MPQLEVEQPILTPKLFQLKKACVIVSVLVACLGFPIANWLLRAQQIGGRGYAVMFYTCLGITFVGLVVSLWQLAAPGPKRNSGLFVLCGLACFGAFSLRCFIMFAILI